MDAAVNRLEAVAIRGSSPRDSSQAPSAPQVFRPVDVPPAVSQQGAARLASRSPLAQGRDADRADEKMGSACAPPKSERAEIARRKVLARNLASVTCKVIIDCGTRCGVASDGRAPDTSVPLQAKDLYRTSARIFWSCISACSPICATSVAAASTLWMRSTTSPAQTMAVSMSPLRAAA